ncbi:unnamed protein product, partial [Musa hybrid cultivar]
SRTPWRGGWKGRSNLGNVVQEPTAAAELREGARRGLHELRRQDREDDEHGRRAALPQPSRHLQAQGGERGGGGGEAPSRALRQGGTPGEVRRRQARHHQSNLRVPCMAWR